MLISISLTIFPLEDLRVDDRPNTNTLVFVTIDAITIQSYKCFSCQVHFYAFHYRCTFVLRQLMIIYEECDFLGLFVSHDSHWTSTNSYMIC